MTLSEYIEAYKEIAMEEMVTHGIPASIKLGQGILESGFGNSDLAVIANNHFGIKCHGWQGRTFYKDDDKVDECFRAYDDPRQSFRDHSEFLTGRPRYAALFALEITDYRGWAHGLRKAGYATNPRYAKLLIGVIERHKLYEFDKLVIASAEINPDTPQLQGKSHKEIVSSQPTGNEDFPTVGVGRDILENNRIRYVYARQGDTPESLARELGLWAWEIYRYNEMGRSDQLAIGDIVYLQPKRRNARQSWHVVQEGETMYDISQKYGVKLKLLYRRNKMEPGTEPDPGRKIQLRAWPSR
ncbi:MAG: glucosaminidase domain-containing protein [Bacteroidota bacterium]